MPALPILIAGFVAYQANFEMAADTMFYQPKTMAHASIAESKLDNNRLVLGVEHGGGQGPTKSIGTVGRPSIR